MHHEILPPPIIPAYLPPGHDPFVEAGRAPGSVLWVRLYASIIAVLNLATIAYLAFFGSLLPDLGSRRSSGLGWQFDAFFIAFMAVMGLFALVHAALCVYLAVCPRKPLTHTIGTVTLALSAFSSGGCLPLGVLLIVFWLKPEVKAWFDTNALASPNAA